jgi:hypothetical protein
VTWAPLEGLEPPAFRSVAAGVLLPMFEKYALACMLMVMEGGPMRWRVLCFDAVTDGHAGRGPFVPN